MRKIHYKIIITIFFAVILLFFNKSMANAATAGISASSTNANVGDSVNINVSINAIAWNLKISGSGISDTIVGGNMDELANKATSKSYKLDTSSTGSYTVTLSGDITDANGNPSDISSSVTVKVSEKTTSNTTNTDQTKNQTQTTQEPTFTTVNQTVYATGDINVRSSYSTSSSAVGSLKKGDSVTRIGVGSNGWSKVQYNGTTAYISSSLLTTTKPEEEEKSTNKALKSLTIEQAELKPTFTPETTNYTMSIGSDIDSLKINAIAEDEKSKVTISGNENLQMGDNTVKIQVTAEDGTIRTYTIIVTKEEKEKLKLESLKISGIIMNESFSPNTYEYTIDLDGTSNLNKLNIEAIANQEDATVEIIGNENFTIGENVITIMLKSKDEKENVTYQILVNKKESITNNSSSEEQEDNKIFLFSAIGIFAVAIIIIIIIIVKSRKKDEQEDEYDNKDFGFDYNNNNNITGELYGIRKESDIKEEKQSYNETSSNKLYDVEKEVDFSDTDDKDRRTRRKGKHSK